MCVCVCVCACVRACVRAFAFVCARKCVLQLSSRLEEVQQESEEKVFELEKTLMQTTKDTELIKVPPLPHHTFLSYYRLCRTLSSDTAVCYSVCYF